MVATIKEKRTLDTTLLSLRGLIGFLQLLHSGVAGGLLVMSYTTLDLALYSLYGHLLGGNSFWNSLSCTYYFIILLFPNIPITPTERMSGRHVVLPYFSLVHV